MFLTFSENETVMAKKKVHSHNWRTYLHSSEIADLTKIPDENGKKVDCLMFCWDDMILLLVISGK